MKRDDVTATKTDHYENVDGENHNNNKGDIDRVKGRSSNANGRNDDQSKENVKDKKAEDNDDDENDVNNNENNEEADEDEGKYFNENITKKSYGPPIISNSTANFSLASINPHIICALCNGYFRDPYTITECLHTFCKSCLFFAFQSGYRKCPKCNASLEPDPYREVLSDRTLGELVHKILPDLHAKDHKDEVLFYERRGIKRKPEFRKDEKKNKSERLYKEDLERKKKELMKKMPEMV